MFYLLLIPGAFFAPVIHEWTKARVSTALGDPTPRNSGFLSWNPFRYFEPIGFLFMFLFRVGWGKPVPTSPIYYKNRRMGVILTYTIPMLANLMVGLLVAVVWTSVWPSVFRWGFSMANIHDLTWLPQATVHLDTMVSLFAICNVMIAVFNLVPIAPMAGNRLLQLFVAPETAMRINHYEKPLQILMILLLIFGILQSLIFSVADMIMRLVGL